MRFLIGSRSVSFAATFSIFAVATLLITAITTTQANAQDLVTNGNFESGNTGWTRSGGTSGITAGSGVNNGYGYFNHASGSTPANVSQLLTTVAGQLYTVTFDFKGNYYSNSSPSSSFSALWNGSAQYSVANDPSITFANHSFDVVGTGSDTISFGGYNNNEAWYVDNVHVTASTASAVPEAGTAALILPVLGMVGAVVLRRKK